MKKLFLTVLFLFSLFVTSGYAQLSYRPSSRGQASSEGSKEFVIGSITVSGTQTLDQDVLIAISKLKLGEVIKVPGDKLSASIKDLWAQNLFDDVEVSYHVINKDTIALELYLHERPRLSKIIIEGVKKGDVTDLTDKKLNGLSGKVVDENLQQSVDYQVKKFYREKGFHNVDIKQTQKFDTLSQKTDLLVNINRNLKTRVNNISFIGNEHLSDATIERAMKGTKARKPYKIFGSKKFVESKFEEDLHLIVAKYNEKGYRDAKVLWDTVYRYDERYMNIEIAVYEGNKYYFGDIVWVGNAAYKTEQLSALLGIKKGDVYNEAHLNMRLSGSPAEDDISSLYLNNGFLFMTVTPIITSVKNDTINIEIQITENELATVNRVYVTGNDRTNDKVIMRELNVKPGDLFSKSDLMRTLRSLNQLGYFDEQQTQPNIQPNMNDGTVDIGFSVVEKPSDQLELSGGFGGGSIVGTLGVSFNNFSIAKLFSKNWGGLLPMGDGQRFAVRLQSNGPQYQAYNFSFSEPWFGGDKPRYFTVSFTHSNESVGGYKKTHPNYSGLKLTGGTIGVGQRLKWPDDWFSLNSSVNINRYIFDNYQSFYQYPTGTSYTFSIKEVLGRNSINMPIYPTEGSNIQLGIEATPPYSLLNGKDYTSPDLPDSEKYKYNEFYRWTFDAGWYTKIIPSSNLVLHLETHWGFLGTYNQDLGTTQFNRWKLGGGGMAGFDYIQGVSIVALRGYADNSVVPEGRVENYYAGSPFYGKFTLETRYPIILNQQASIYALAFFEAGNVWDSFQTIEAFNMKRAVGAGLRVFLPIFGMLGFDYGYGFDPVPPVPGMGRANGSQFHFTIGQSLNGIF